MRSVNSSSELWEVLSISEDCGCISTKDLTPVVGHGETLRIDVQVDGNRRKSDGKNESSVFIQMKGGAELELIVKAFVVPPIRFFPSSLSYELAESDSGFETSGLLLFPSEAANPRVEGDAWFQVSVRDRAPYEEGADAMEIVVSGSNRLDLNRPLTGIVTVQAEMLDRIEVAKTEFVL